MSTIKGSFGGHNFHGAPERFEAVAEYVYKIFRNKIKNIADVAGGQGMLARVLRKKYNYEVDVIDPRGWTLVGVSSRKEIFLAEMATFYDLIIGLHPDEATREVAESAMFRPVILIPCCNCWDKTQKLGREALLNEIGKYYDQQNIKYKKVVFNFNSSKNVGLVSYPPKTDR